MTSTGPGHPASADSYGPPQESADRLDRSAHVRGLDEMVQIVFAAGLSLRVAAEMSDQPEIVRRLERIGSDLDEIVRSVWHSNLPCDVPLGPSEPTIEGPALARGTRSKRPSDPESE